MVLTYHNIGVEAGFNTVKYKAFEQQIAHLKQHFDIVSADSYINYIKTNGRSKEGSVLLTFDDAYTSFKELVFPLMSLNNLPSTVFVCTGYLGRSNEWDNEENRIPIMDELSMLKLSESSLVTIGAHTVSHRSLSSLKDDDIKYELIESKKSLERLTGKAVNYFAYPYGQLYLNVNKTAMKAANEAAYLAAFSTNFNNINHKSDLYKLNRVDIISSDDLNIFYSKLKHNNYYYYKQNIKNAYSFLKTLK